MDNSTSQNESVVRYLDGEMSDIEKQEFEKKLAGNESLRQELADLKVARDAIRIFGLKQKVLSIHREMMTEASAPAFVKKMNAGRRIVKYSLAVAASILILAICVAGYNFFSLSANKLYNEKYSSFELPNLRGDQQTSATAIEKAYRQKDYEKVVNLPASRNETNIKDEFLTALSYLEVNRPAEAIKLFSGVIELNRKSGRTIYEDDAEYYLALCYLKIREYDKALHLMDEIREKPSHIYHDKFTSGFIRKVKMLKWR